MVQVDGDLLPVVQHIVRDRTRTLEVLDRDIQIVSFYLRRIA